MTRHGSFKQWTLLVAGMGLVTASITAVPASASTAPTGVARAPAQIRQFGPQGFPSDFTGPTPTSQMQRLGDTDALDVGPQELGKNRLISRNLIKVSANNFSRFPSISGDGSYVAYDSYASDLVEGDANQATDAFGWNRIGRATRMLSGDPSEAEPFAASYDPKVSADGQFTAFWSDADNLVSGDTNKRADIFLYDKVRDELSLVSKAADGSPADGSSRYPAISQDGRYVAYESMAENMAVGGGPRSDVFLFDRTTGTNMVVSSTPDGSIARGNSTEAAINNDGRYVSFTTTASNLLPRDRNKASDVLVFDHEAGTLSLVSSGTDGESGNEESFASALSANGEYVAFSSRATNLTSREDPNDVADIFVQDREAGTTNLVSRSTSDGPTNGYSADAAISGSGRYIAYWSVATNVIMGDGPGFSDVVVFDTEDESTRLVSIARDLTLPDGASFSPSISSDGRYVAFFSWATNVVKGDLNSYADVFVYRLS